MKRNKGDFGGVTAENGGTKFYFRCRSFVDIQTGKVLAERKQQCVLLGTQDNSQYKNLKSGALYVKADEIRRRIVAWEEAAENGQPIAADGSVPAPRVEPVAPSGDMKIGDFFEKVFLPAKRGLRDSGKLAAITVRDYEKIWGTFLKAHFNGTQTFRNYTAWKGQSYLENLRKKDGTLYGEAVIRKIRSVASAVFTEAIDRGFLDASVPPKFNPWESVKVAKLPAISPEQGEAYTEAEVKAIIRNLELGLGDTSKPLVEARDMNIRNAQVAIALGFWAGLRPSETAALDWRNVDVTLGTIKVCESVVDGVAAKRTKTSVDRTIFYLEPLVVILREWHKQQGSPRSGLVIHKKNGNHVSLRHLMDEIIRPACEKVGLRWSGLYSCRRGCGTHLYLIDVPVAKAAKFMGNTVEVYIKHYVVDKGEGSADVARIDRERRLVKTQAKGAEAAPVVLTEQKKLQGELAALGIGGEQ